ncbi:MAG: glycosyltransferase family 39 protein [Betaproteobacteria bacterium]|nr:glycosyltransferase family 39 protein [Betaproteobacteria bacterium]
MNNFSSAPGSRVPQLPTPAFLLLVLAWLIPGLVGHEPWKPDEAYTFGLIAHIAATGDWIVPTLAGEPFMEKPPLFFISAALFMKCFSGLLPAHDAARLAAGLWMALAFLAVGMSARQIFGKGNGRWAVLVLLGCLGLTLRAHQMITDTALFAGFAWGLCGLSFALRRPLLGGLMLGAGGSIAFLSKGLLGPGCLGLAAILLPILFRDYRNRRFMQTLLLALALGAPLPLLWMAHLYERDPGLFHTWFFVNNFGRFSGTAQLGPTAGRLFYLKTLPWHSLPALPLALLGAWQVWRGRVRLDIPRLAPAFLIFLVTSLILATSADARELYMMPLLVPLAVLALTGIQAHDPNKVWAGLSIALGGLALAHLLLLTLGGLALATGTPQALTTLLTRRLFEGWIPEWHSIVWAAFALLILLIAALWRRVPRATPQGFVWRWALLIVLTWSGLATLWLPALDHSKRYREVFSELKPFLQQATAQNECVASFALGEPQRAMLEYYAQFRTQRLEVSDAALSCRWLLVQSLNNRLPEALREVQPVFSTSRPGDQRERFSLYYFSQGVGQIWAQGETTGKE